MGPCSRATSREYACRTGASERLAAIAGLGTAPPVAASGRGAGAAGFEEPEADGRRAGRGQAATELAELEVVVGAGAGACWGA